MCIKHIMICLETSLYIQENTVLFFYDTFLFILAPDKTRTLLSQFYERNESFNTSSLRLSVICTTDFKRALISQQFQFILSYESNLYPKVFLHPCRIW